MAYSFLKIFFIGQNLKEALMTHSLFELLIFFLLTLLIFFLLDIYCLEFISHHIKEILYINTDSKGNQSWNKNKEINIFTCFQCRVKILYQQFLFFLSFMNIFWSSSLQMFFKIGTLENFLIFWIRKRFQHTCFPVNIA